MKCIICSYFESTDTCEFQALESCIEQNLSRMTSWGFYRSSGETACSKDDEVLSVRVVGGHVEKSRTHSPSARNLLGTYSSRATNNLIICVAIWQQFEEL